MITTLLLLVQVADTATTLPVREGDKITPVPIVFTATGRFVAADQMAVPLGARLARVSQDRYEMTMGGATMQFTVQLPAVRVGKHVMPLPAAPVQRSGVLFVPIVAFTDVLPRVAVGYAFDRSKGEIRRVVTEPVETKSAGGSAASPSTPVDGDSASPRTRTPRSGPVIVVDAGHGGPDRGMRGPAGARRQIQEADITLAVARLVRDALRERGAEVIMTRSTDTLIALRDRGRIANKAEGDLFVSIHVNAANPRWPNPRAARGVETYFLSEAKTEDERRVAEMENDAQKYDVGVNAEPGDPFSFMMADMVQNEYLRESSELAAQIQRSLATMHPGGNRGVKQAGFAVLVTAHMPAVLVEIGFGTNVAEAAYLNSAGDQQRLARAIATATMRYFNDYQHRRTSGRAPMQ